MGQLTTASDSPSPLIDKIAYWYNLFNQDPIVFNFTEYPFGEQVAFEELTTYFNETPPDHYRFCIVIACPVEVFPQANLFSRVLYIRATEFEQLITRFPILLDGPYFMGKPSMVANGLFIGQLDHVRRYDLSKLQIQTIINMTNDTLPEYATHPNYHHFSILDSLSTNIRDILVQVESIIRRSPKNCLVFCHKGVSRSGSMVLYYITQQYAYPSIDHALRDIRTIYPKLEPNHSFMNQLEEVVREQRQEQQQQQ